MLGKVDVWGQTVGLYQKSLKTGKYLYLKFCASWITFALTPTNVLCFMRIWSIL